MNRQNPVMQPPSRCAPGAPHASQRRSGGTLTRHLGFCRRPSVGGAVVPAPVHAAAPGGPHGLDGSPWDADHRPTPPKACSGRWRWYRGYLRKAEGKEVPVSTSARGRGDEGAVQRCFERVCRRVVREVVCQVGMSSQGSMVAQPMIVHRRTGHTRLKWSERSGLRDSRDLRDRRQPGLRRVRTSCRRHGFRRPSAHRGANAAPDSSR